VQHNLPCDERAAVLGADQAQVCATSQLETQGIQQPVYRHMVSAADRTCMGTTTCLQLLS
jgi:hypothetical protein